MTPWVLYFWAIFANGQSMLFENNDRFKTNAGCYLAGGEKGPWMQMTLWKESGIPVQVRFRCVKEDTPA
jgi:hypothetical protein